MRHQAVRLPAEGLHSTEGVSGMHIGIRHRCTLYQSEEQRGTSLSPTAGRGIAFAAIAKVKMNSTMTTQPAKKELVARHILWCRKPA
jgi:hypothetical protein